MSISPFGFQSSGRVVLLYVQTANLLIPSLITSEVHLNPIRFSYHFLAVWLHLMTFAQISQSDACYTNTEEVKQSGKTSFK